MVGCFVDQIMSLLIFQDKSRNRSYCPPRMYCLSQLCVIQLQATIALGATSHIWFRAARSYAVCWFSIFPCITKTRHQACFARRRYVRRGYMELYMGLYGAIYGALWKEGNFVVLHHGMRKTGKRIGKQEVEEEKRKEEEEKRKWTN